MVSNNRLMEGWRVQDQLRLRGTVALTLVVSAEPESPSLVPGPGSDAGWKGKQKSPGRAVGTELAQSSFSK